MGVIKKVYILHGWTYSATNIDPLDKWDLFIKLLKSKGLEVTLLHIPGLTKTVDQVWDLENYVEWVREEVSKENSKVILIGHSNGGRIALSFTEKYPEKVSQLILIDSAGIYHNELLHRIKKALFRSIAKLGKKITSSEILKNLLYKLAREGDYKNATSAQRQTMLDLINTDLTSILGKIQTATLILWGEEDTITPLLDGKLMQKLISNSKLHIIKGAKHSPQFTHTEEVVSKIVGEINS